MTALYIILIATAILTFGVATYLRVRPFIEAADAPSASRGGTTSGTDTEFTAEVVRITDVSPHPNADRLEIAKFEMKTGPVTYEVVIGKGTQKVGDLAAYLSVDCIVPIDRPQFKFLGDRLDGKGKTHYRLKAARLRGTFSQGLLVDLPASRSWDLGDSVAEEFGVTYYTPPEDRYGGPGSSPTGTSVARKPRMPVMPVYSVESLKKVPNLFADGEIVVATEKVHGSNARFAWLPKRFLGIRIGWKFVVGSHRVIKSTDGAASSDGNHFYGEDVWLDAAAKCGLRERLRKYPGYMFYGEVFGYTKTGKKIQDMTYGRSAADGPGLVFFDVRHPDGHWLGYDERVALCRELGLDVVPLVTLGEWSKDLLALAEGPSLIAPEQIREGIVVESLTGPRRKAKFVSQSYLLREDGGKFKAPKTKGAKVAA